MPQAKCSVIRSVVVQRNHLQKLNNPPRMTSLNAMWCLIMFLIEKWHERTTFRHHETRDFEMYTWKTF